MSNWNQPQCESCWVLRNTDGQGRIREPVRVLPGHGPAETCAFCGMPTWVGIWVRVDPTTVPYPTLEGP